MPKGFFDAGSLANGGRIYRKSAPEGNNAIKQIWVPNTVTVIENCVFKDYMALEDVVFEEGPLPLSIGMMAFEGCRAMVRVSLPGRVSDIGTACFRNCVNLTDFRMTMGSADLKMPLRVFDGCLNKDRLCAVLRAECEGRAAIIEAEIAAASLAPNKIAQPIVVGQYLLYPEVKGEVAQVLPEGIPNGTLLVCVDRTWGIEKKDDTTRNRISLEDCSRGYWCDVHLRKVRLAECHWLMAIADNKIEGVWKIDEKTGWKKPEEIPKPTWPSDKGPWEVPRSGCLFLPDDDETRTVRAACVGKAVMLSFAQHQTVRGVFRREQ